MTAQERDDAMHEAFEADPATVLRSFRIVLGLTRGTNKHGKTDAGRNLEEVLVKMHDGLKNGRAG